MIGKKISTQVPDHFVDLFHRDFSFMLLVFRMVDIQYGEAKIEFLHNYLHLKRLVVEWNKKYPNLIMTISQNTFSIKPNIILEGGKPATYSSSAIADENSKEFLACAKLAFKNFNPQIQIREEGSFFCFDLDKITEERAGLDWQRRRNFF